MASLALTVATRSSAGVIAARRAVTSTAAIATAPPRVGFTARRLHVVVAAPARRACPGAVAAVAGYRAGARGAGAAVAALAGLVGGGAAIVSCGVLDKLGKPADVTSFNLNDLDDEREKSEKPPRARLAQVEALAEEHPDDMRVQWRLARALYDVAEEKATPKEEAKDLMTRALATIKRTHEKDRASHDVARWHGIILSGMGRFQSSKEYIANLYTIRDLWEQAVENNPSDASAHHLLGRWAHDIAALSWVKRKLASALFGSPPTATYAEALEHFERAEAISPGFWKKNLVMLAKCEVQLGNTESAHQYATRALDMPVRTDEDKEAHEEAAELARNTMPKK